MKFKVGDSVMVIDDAISGMVSKIKDKHIFVETEDGFEFSFTSEELILHQHSNELKTTVFHSQSISSVIAEKEAFQKKPLLKIKPKERSQPTVVIDLHIDKLMGSTKYMNNYDMLTLQLNTVTQQLEFAMRKRIQKLVFIHGVGEGVLRMELETLLRRYDNLKFYDADYKTYGYGATEVYFFQNANN